MKALLLCASHNDLGLVRSIRKLGYDLIITGNQPGLVGEKFADKYIQADYSDKELILQIAQEEKIDVICQCCNDFGVYTAAYVAEKMKLPGYDSYEITLTLHNKDKFKKFAKQHEILSPISSAFSDIKNAEKYLEDVLFPIIVKPTDASAGNGIHRANTKEEAREAIREAFEKSRAGRIVIEPFIIGTQHGFCTFLIGKKVVAYSSNNEYSILNPYRVEIDTFPADNYKEISNVLIEQIEKIASILDLKDGIFHLQYIMQNGKPYIIEVMRRILGNMYSVPASLLNGFDWDYWETRAKCGLSLKNFPQNTHQEGFFAYKTLLGKRNGEIRTIQIPEQYKKYLIGTFLLKEEGSIITKYQSEPIGFLFFMFASQDEMRRILIEEYNDSIVEIV